MISFSSLYKPCIYLIGFMVTCFLYLGCFSSSSVRSTYQSSIKEISVATQVKMKNGLKIDIAVAGRAKNGLNQKNGLAYKFGDDSCFVKTIENPLNQKVIFGVADGVGSCWEEGIDPGKFSSALMTNIALSSAESPQAMIRDGYTQLLKNPHQGSSTVCVATIDHLGLKWANLGDSKLIVVRNKMVVHETTQREHGFNYPFQLGILPDHCGDCPDDCICGEYQLEKGDFVLMATDGFFDNVDDTELMSVLNPYNFANEIADNLVKKAYENSLNSGKRSPFAYKAMAAGDSHNGGKKDDISIIVTVVK